jgi:hypothetical protein
MLWELHPSVVGQLLAAGPAGGVDRAAHSGDLLQLGLLRIALHKIGLKAGIVRSACRWRESEMEGGSEQIFVMRVRFIDRYTSFYFDDNSC